MRKSGKWWRETTFDQVFIGLILIVFAGTVGFIRAHSAEPLFAAVCYFPYGLYIAGLVFATPVMLLYWIVGMIVDRGDEDGPEDV